MNESHTITIHSEFDVITARMKVRELARLQGFAITDQARISLATSSLANTLGLGRRHQGQIVVECVNNGEESVGIRVVCTAARDIDSDLTPESLKNTGWLVDNLTVETLPSNDVQVTAVHWAPSRR